ncbi:hypothetical protein GGR58DRAFT_505410 [Xylaria digitata]|nr:hypothetical protein GGR58DRAFT_505410 [Xylaria digitata]
MVCKLVRRGHSLAAVTQTFRYGYDHPFKNDPRDAFSAQIHIFYISEMIETLRILMQFHKGFHLIYKLFLAGLLLLGIVSRYLKGFFLRDFMIAEGDYYCYVVLHHCPFN